MSPFERVVFAWQWMLGRIAAEPVAARMIGLFLAGALARYGIKVDWNLVFVGFGFLGIPTVASARRKVVTVKNHEAQVRKALYTRVPRGHPAG